MVLNTGHFGKQIRNTGKFKTWCSRRLEKFIWADRVGNTVLHRFKKERNILRTLNRRKANYLVDWSRLAKQLPSHTRY